MSACVTLISSPNVYHVSAQKTHHSHKGVEYTGAQVNCEGTAVAGTADTKQQ